MRCTDAASDYLGADLAAPWSTVVDQMSPESWAAGTRTTYCSLVQLDEAGNERPLEGAARPPAAG